MEVVIHSFRNERLKGFHPCQILPVVAPDHFLCYKQCSKTNFYYILVAHQFALLGSKITNINLDGTHGIDVHKQGHFQGVTVSTKLKFSSSSHIACLAIIVTNSKSHSVYLSSLGDVKDALNLCNVETVWSDFETNYQSVSIHLWTLSSHYFCVIHWKRNLKKKLRECGFEPWQCKKIICNMGQLWLDVFTVHDLKTQWPVSLFYYCIEKSFRYNNFIILFHSQYNIKFS